MRFATRGIAALSLSLLATQPAVARETQARMQVSVLVAPPPCSVAQSVVQGPQRSPAWGAMVQLNCAQPVPVVVSLPGGAPVLVLAGPGRQAKPHVASPVRGEAGGLLLLTY
jgi:hypothetical protein